MSLIEIRNLKYRYPGTTELALNDISLNIEKGQFVGIAGENGAGKVHFPRRFLDLYHSFIKAPTAER